METSQRNLVVIVENEITDFNLGGYMNRIFSMLLVLMLIPASVFCSTATVTDREVNLQPQGWVSGTLAFKPGSTVELNKKGEVISGVLKYNEYLRSVGIGYSMGSDTPARLYYKGSDATTVFDERGRVISGTLAGHYNYIYLIPYSEPLVLFKIGTSITFDKNGNVLKGTLRDDTNLRPTGLKSTKFKAETEVVFGPGAQVIKGTIANDLSLNGTTYPAGTTLQFSESDYPHKI
jgi:hypothetical protein